MSTVWNRTIFSSYSIDVNDQSMFNVTIAYDLNTGWSFANPSQEVNCTNIGAGKLFADFLRKNEVAETIVLEKTAKFAVHSRRAN